MTGVAWADGDDFELKIDPIMLQVLATDVDTDSSKFAEYTDYSSGFMIPVLSIEGTSAKSDRYLSIFGENIYRDHARLGLDYGITGQYDLTIDYNKIPHNFGNNGTFLWNKTGKGRYEIADPIQSDLQTAIENQPSRDFDFIESLIGPHLEAAGKINLGLQRNRFLAAVDFGSMNTFSWGVEYKNEKRSGERVLAGTFGFNNPQELPEPIDYETTDATIRGEWTGDGFGLQFGYRYSMFENDTDILVWDNPYFLTDGTDGRAYLAPTSTNVGPSTGVWDLAPDNESDTLFVSGRLKFAETWWLSGNLSTTNMSQDDPLQPFTPNTAIEGVRWPSGELFDPTTTATLPVQKASADVDVLNFTWDLGTSVGEDWRFKLLYRYYDYDNSSSRVELDGYVRTYAVWEEIPRITVPYGYTKQDIGAEVQWDVSESGVFGFNYKYRTWDREFRETESSDENVFKLTYDHRFNERWDFRASWENGDRSHDGYEVEAQEYSFRDPEGINNQPTLRKYLQADREYDDYEVTVNWFPTDVVQVMFGVSGLEEDYPEGEFGLLSSEATSLNFEVSWMPRDAMSFFVFGHTTDGESFQRARQSGGTLSTDPNDDWEVTLDDDNDVFGLGFDAQINERWATNISTQWSESDGYLDFFTTPAGAITEAVDIPNYDDSELFFFKIRCTYEINSRTKVGVGYWYEDFTFDAELLQGVDNYTAGLIALVPNFGDYTANVFSFDLSFSL
jgi:MtrB/PioB family decaheme-associated outer membrane protein